MLHFNFPCPGSNFLYTLLFLYNKGFFCRSVYTLKLSSKFLLYTDIEHFIEKVFHVTSQDFRRPAGAGTVQLANFIGCFVSPQQVSRYCLESTRILLRTIPGHQRTHAGRSAGAITHSSVKNLFLPLLLKASWTLWLY